VLLRWQGSLNVKPPRGMKSECEQNIGRDEHDLVSRSAPLGYCARLDVARKAAARPGTVSPHSMRNQAGVCQRPSCHRLRTASGHDQGGIHVHRLGQRLGGKNEVAVARTAGPVQDDGQVSNSGSSGRARTARSRNGNGTSMMQGIRLGVV